MLRRLRTLRHLRSDQLYHRLRLLVRRALWERVPGRIDRVYRSRAKTLGHADFGKHGLAQVAQFRLAMRRPDDRARTAGDALLGRFEFLGRKLDFGADVDWHRGDLDSGTRLWKTQLHEFSYAVDLAAAARDSGDSKYRERIFGLVESWDQSCPIGRAGFAKDCWNARAAATRLMNLAVAGSLLELRFGEADSHRLSGLLALHGLFLRDNLEVDLRGNHLLRDRVALVFAGELFPPLGDGLEELRDEVHEQVLSDGCHYERVPLYHAVVLQDLLETRLLLGERTPAWLDDAVLRMATFLEGLLHGDGDLPLLGDTWLGEVDVQQLLSTIKTIKKDAGARAAAPAPAALHGGSGLVVLRRPSLHAVVRVGSLGPDFQLGHAHGDLLSFELSHGPRRLVTDTGTLTYDPGPERSSLRATSAHNTVEIDGQSQIEAWASFRVGRRGRAWIESQGEADGWTWVWGAHDAYRWLSGRPTHHRLLALSDHALVVVDAVLGSGRHRVTSRLHFRADPRELRLGLTSLGGTAMRRNAPLYERWGQTLSMVQESTDEQVDLPWAGGWVLWLEEGDGPPPVSTLERSGSRIEVSCAEWSFPFRVVWDLEAHGDVRAVQVGTSLSAR